MKNKPITKAWGNFFSVNREEAILKNLESIKKLTIPKLTPKEKNEN